MFHLKLNFDCTVLGTVAGRTLTKVLSQTPAGESVAIRITDLTHSKQYSYQALHALPSAIVAEQLPQMGASIGQALTWDGTKWWPDSVGTGNGSVTTINTGSGLTGGPISTTGTISIANSGVGTAELANNAVTAAKINAGEITNSHISGTAAIDYSKLNIGVGEIPQDRINGLSSAMTSLIEDVINDAETGKAPSQNAVYDALGLKADRSNITQNITAASVTGLTAPIAGADAANKTYVDNAASTVDTRVTTEVATLNTSIGNKYDKSGGVITGDVTLNTQLHLKGGANAVTVKANAATANYVLTLPASAGTSGYILATDGSGNTSWVTSTVGSSSITDGSIVDADINATAAIAQSKISNLTTDLAGKQPLISAGTTAQYYRGDKTFVDLATDVRGTVLTGYAVGTNTALTATDTTLGAFQNLQGQIDATNTAVAGKEPSFAAGSTLQYYRGDKSWQTLNGGVVANTPAGTIAATTVQAALNELDGDKQATIATGTTAQYYRGDKTWATFATDAINSVLSTFAVGVGTKPAVTNGDTVVGAFGKVQKTLNDINADYVSKTADQTINGNLKINSLTGFITVPDPVLGKDAANKDYVDGFGQWTKSVSDVYRSSGNVGIGAAPLSSLDLSSRTDAIAVPKGTTVQQPSSPIAGMLRFNTTTSNLEVYDGTTWAASIAGGSTVSPAGLVSSFSSSTCPAGWIEANGATISRTTYASLFAAVGTTFGAGDGSTTFKLPDLRGEFIRGFDNGRGVDTGRVFGSNQKGTLGVGDDGNGVNSVSFGVSFPASAQADAASAGDYPGVAASSSTAENVNFYTTAGANAYYGVVRPRNIAMIYCVSTATAPLTTIASSGSGTTNKIPVWTSSTALGDSPMSVSGTNVGIGTASPGQKLTVAGTIESTSGGVKYPDATTQATSAFGPVFSIYTNTATSTANTVYAKIQYNQVDFDPDSCLDAANSRIKPTKAGYYRVSLTMNVTHFGTGGFTNWLGLYKNGSTIRQVSELINYGASYTQSHQISTIVYMNGTTDYLEGWYTTNSTNGATISPGLSSTYFSGEWIRP